MTNIDTKILTDIGMSEDQATIYLFLLENGTCSAGNISKKANIGRAQTYKVLGQLASLELVESRNDIGKIELFSALHPSSIKSRVEKQMDLLENAYSNLKRDYGVLSTKYNVLKSRPSVQFYEGLEGLKVIYGDILDVNKDIAIISSPINEDRDDVLDFIREQINLQVAQNIHTKAITPIGTQKRFATPLGHDAKYLITKKEIPADVLNIPAQIILYGDKVAITNFKDSLISILIESKYINETFKHIFNYMWNQR